MFIDPKYPIALDFFYQMAKRIRKYDGAFVVATQSISDWNANEELASKTTAIIKNSQYNFIFKLNPSDVEDLVAVYRSGAAINEVEQYNIANAKKGEAFFIGSTKQRTSFKAVAPYEIEKLFKQDSVEGEDFDDDFEEDWEEEKEVVKQKKFFKMFKVKKNGKTDIAEDMAENETKTTENTEKSVKKEKKRNKSKKETLQEMPWSEEAQDELGEGQNAPKNNEIQEEQDKAQETSQGEKIQEERSVSSADINILNLELIEQLNKLDAEEAKRRDKLDNEEIKKIDNLIASQSSAPQPKNLEECISSFNQKEQAEALLEAKNKAKRIHKKNSR